MFLETPNTFGPYDEGEAVSLGVIYDDLECNYVMDNFQFYCPPDNDSFSDAIELEVGSDSAADAFTTLDTTAQENEPTPECFNQRVNSSVWFYFIAPPSGEVEISTDIEGGTLTDTEMAVYSAEGVDVNDITTLGESLACDQNGGETVEFNPVIVFSNSELEGGKTTNNAMTPGAEYYTQVDKWGTAEDGTFGLTVTELNTTSVKGFENKQFIYFPNPVTNTLSFRAKNHIEAISVYDMLGHKVLSSKPGAINSDLNMNNLKSGTYFVKVTINGNTETVKVVKK